MTYLKPILFETSYSFRLRTIYVQYSIMILPSLEEKFETYFLTLISFILFQFLETEVGCSKFHSSRLEAVSSSSIGNRSTPSV